MLLHVALATAELLLESGSTRDHCPVGARYSGPFRTRQSASLTASQIRCGHTQQPRRSGRGCRSRSTTYLFFNETTESNKVTLTSCDNRLSTGRGVAFSYTARASFVLARPSAFNAFEPHPSRRLRPPTVYSCSVSVTNFRMDGCGSTRM